MELDSILLWFSYLSLVFWSGVLIWCVATIVIRQKKEKEWLKHYVPTLQSDIAEPEIHSWLTLTQVEMTKEDLAGKRRARKAKTKSDSGSP
jgi:hypothetical protein